MEQKVHEELEREPKQLLTLRGAARLLEVSPTTVLRWVRENRIPAIRLGPRTIRIRVSDIDRMLRPAFGQAGAKRPAESSIGSQDHRLKIVDPSDHANMFAEYDPEAVRTALDALVGGFAGLDTEKLKRDVRQARGQKSSGRVWP